jgi:hypothetical protein
MASNDGLTREDLLSQAADMTREELLDLVADLSADFVHANRIANTQATAFGWCAEYEDRVQKYNEEFKVLKMDGRGKRMGNARNVFAARRLSMGHVMSTCERLGVKLPEGAAWGGVVREPKELDTAHDELSQRLNAEAPQDPAETPQPVAPTGTPSPL